MKPDRAKARILVRTIGMPPAPARHLVVADRHQAAGHAPVAPHHHHQHRQRRARPSENHAKVRSSARDRPNSDGAASSVDCGSGRPVQTWRCTSGTVQHGVASTVACMNSANPSVLTARYRPAHAQRGEPDEHGHDGR